MKRLEVGNGLIPVDKPRDCLYVILVKLVQFLAKDFLQHLKNIATPLNSAILHKFLDLVHDIANIDSLTVLDETG